MKRARGGILGVAVVLLVLLSVSDVRAQGTKVRWDIVSLPSFNPVTVNPGGFASALARDGSRITMTGSGTFVVGEPANVAGGGVWLTRGPLGNVTGFGTYQVTELIKFDEAPGTLPAAVVDNLGKHADFRGGLALLRIGYSDGSGGVLTVSCRAPAGAPDAAFEGITATKGFVDYWHHEHDVPLVDGNRTSFHVVP